MPRHKSVQPTDVELQILQILWEIGPCGVGDIHRRLEAEKGTNYSTTVKMLAVMREKNLVKRNESVTPHLYRAAATKQKTQQRMLGDLINRLYGGDTRSLVLQALSSKGASANDIEAIEAIIEQMKERQE